MNSDEYMNSKEYQEENKKWQETRTIYNVRKETIMMAVSYLEGEGHDDFAEELIYKSSKYYSDRSITKEQILEHYRQVGFLGDY